MTIFDDIEPDDEEGGPKRSFRQILVENALDKDLTPNIIAKCFDDQITVVVAAPTEAWVNALMGPIAERCRSFPARPGPFIFKRSPARRTGPAKDDPDLSTLLVKLLAGTSVIGMISPDSEPLPALTDNPDYRVEIQRPDQLDVAKALAEATGCEIEPGQIPILNTLDLDALCIAIRPRSSLKRTLQRLEALSVGPVEDDAVPRLEQLAGYGAAKLWALSAKRVLEQIRAGHPDVTLADLPRGALLVGPAGVGKSIFAKSFAKSLNIPSVITSVSDWMGAGDTHLGTVIKAARASIDKATAFQPGFLFIDEVDSLADRDNEASSSASWWLNFVNAVLSAIDGAIKTPGLIVVGACNNLHRVDKALRRSGRLETVVEIGLPDEADRLSIFSFYVGDAIAIDHLRPCAFRSAGSSGADIQRAVREARQSAREQNRRMTVDDLLAALAPPEALTYDELRTAARHEAGHALANLLVGDRLLGVDIERGVTHLRPMSRILDSMAIDRLLVTHLAGRAADQILSGKANSGAGGPLHSDLGQATALSAARHGSFGLGDALVFVGPVHEVLRLVQSDHDLRSKVERDLQIAYASALDLLSSHKPALAALAEELLDRRFMPVEEISSFLSGKLEAAL